MRAPPRLVDGGGGEFVLRLIPSVGVFVCSYMYVCGEKKEENEAARQEIVFACMG